MVGRCQHVRSQDYWEGIESNREQRGTQGRKERPFMVMHGRILSLPFFLPLSCPHFSFYPPSISHISSPPFCWFLFVHHPVFPLFLLLLQHFATLNSHPLSVTHSLPLPITSSEILRLFASLHPCIYELPSLSLSLSRCVSHMLPWQPHNGLYKANK